jgi:hypothetical protein
VAASDTHSKRKILDVLARREDTLLHFLEEVQLQPVRDMVDILTATSLHVAWQRCQEDHYILLEPCELMDQLPKHIKLAFSIQKLQYTIDVVCTRTFSSLAWWD